MEGDVSVLGDLWNRLRRPVWPWGVALAVAVLVVVIGLSWLDGLDIRTEARETWSTRIVFAAGVGVLVVEAVRRVRWWLGAAALIVLAAGTYVMLDGVIEEVEIEEFTEAERRPTATPDELPEPVPGEAARPSPLIDDPDALADVAITFETVVEGLSQPVAVEPIPATDSFYVLEREGPVRVVDGEGDLSDPVLDLTGRVPLEGEQGMLDLAIDPDGRRLYVSLINGGEQSEVRSYEIGDDLSLSDPWTVITVGQPYETHNGGAIEFDRDGYLLFALGDGGRLRDILGTGQDRTNRLSTMLRIVPLDGGGYAVPPDNPYLDTDGVWPEIYAYGLRNPWRFSVDSVTGDIWIGDVGQDRWEEINRIPYGHLDGANFGWGLMEGDDVRLGKEDDPTGFTDEDIPADHTPPVFTYAHDADRPEGARNSVTGGYVYRGAAIPELWGTYVYADFSAGFIGGVLLDGEARPVADTELMSDVVVPVAFGVDHDGEILVVSFGGSIERIVAGAG